jgi:predicted Zn-dependent peptidase
VNSERPQRGERRARFYKEAQVETFGVAWHVPQADGEGFYAMELLQNILGTGRSSRLYKRLVYDAQAAQDVLVSNEWNRHPGLFKIFIDMKPERKAEEGEKMLDEEIARLHESEVSDSELQKAKNNIRAYFIRQMKTNNGKGQVAGQFEILWGGWAKHKEFLDKIDAVTKADIKAAAAKYLTDLNRSVVTLVPKEPPATPQQAPRAASAPGPGAEAGATQAAVRRCGGASGDSRCDDPRDVAEPLGGASRLCRIDLDEQEDAGPQPRGRTGERARR